MVIFKDSFANMTELNTWLVKNPDVRVINVQFIFGDDITGYYLVFYTS